MPWRSIETVVEPSASRARAGSGGPRLPRAAIATVGVAGLLAVVALRGRASVRAGRGPSTVVGGERDRRVAGPRRRGRSGRLTGDRGPTTRARARRRDRRRRRASRRLSPARRVARRRPGRCGRRVRPRVDTARAAAGAQPRRAARRWRPGPCPVAGRCRRRRSSRRRLRPGGPSADGSTPDRPEPRDGRASSTRSPGSARRRRRRSSRPARRRRSPRSTTSGRASSSARRPSRGSGSSSRSAEVPRSGWLAVGAVVAAWSSASLRADGRRGRARLAGRRRGRSSGWAAGRRGSPRAADSSALIGAPALLVRAVALPGPDAARCRDRLATRGPWTFVVECGRVAARDGQQTATLRLIAVEAIGRRPVAAPSGRDPAGHTPRSRPGIG